MATSWDGVWGATIFEKLGFCCYFGWWFLFTDSKTWSINIKPPFGIILFHFKPKKQTQENLFPSRMNSILRFFSTGHNEKRTPHNRWLAWQYNMKLRWCFSTKFGWTSPECLEKIKMPVWHSLTICTYSSMLKMAKMSPTEPCPWTF